MSASVWLAARVRKADSDKIGFLLDAGAMAIICPMINTAQEVCRVPTHGRHEPHGLINHHGLGDGASSPLPHPLNVIRLMLILSPPPSLPLPSFPPAAALGARLRVGLPLPPPGHQVLRARKGLLPLRVSPLSVAEPSYQTYECGFGSCAEDAAFREGPSSPPSKRAIYVFGGPPRPRRCSLGWGVGGSKAT